MPLAEPRLGPEERILILTPSANAHRQDFAGAFKPESLTLEKIYGGQATIERVPVASIDPATLRVHADQRTFEGAAQAVLAKISDGTPWTRIVLLCHGWATGLQLGFRTGKRRGKDLKHWEQLIAALKDLPSLKSVTLFACSAGKEPLSKTTSPGTGDNSLADLLRDQCGVTVIAHTTAGHATRNPDLIVFERSAVPVLGGIVPCARKSEVYRNAIRLLSLKPNPTTRRAPGRTPPQGHSRVAFASIPLCESASELHALLSSPPARS